MTANYPKAVGIFEDNTALSNTIKHGLALSNEYFVVFAYPSIDAVDKELEVIPDYVLLDIHLNDVNSMEMIGNLRHRLPGADIIIITGDTDSQLILKAFENGAKGYLHKPFSIQDLLAALNKVQAEGSYLAPASVTSLIQLINKTALQEPRTDYELTRRETEIVALLKKGLSYNEIAAALHLSYHTINHHLKNIYLKANVRSRSELIAKFITS